MKFRDLRRAVEKVGTERDEDDVFLLLEDDRCVAADGIHEAIEFDLGGVRALPERSIIITATESREN